MCKIYCMDYCEKICLLNCLTEPFGFFYLPDEDIMTTRIDTWQKDFGYCSLYDKSALHFQMIFDYEPVYFDYNDRTWRIEFWKGQYGINVGGEVGIYQADSILTPEQYDHTLFHGVSETEMLPICMELNFKGKQLFSVCDTHWWLTGFHMGSWCEPEDLTINISITFPCQDMMNCFVESLIRLGYHKCDICICDLTVTFPFSVPHTKQSRCEHKCLIRISQWKNRILCKLYQRITRPFTCTMDRILYLYFFFPIAFRHMFHFKRNRRQKIHRRHR